VQEQRVIRLRIRNKPLHSPQNILLRRLIPRILLVIRQYHHVLPPVPELLRQECRHVLNVVDAPAELALLAEVVDADQQRLPLARAVGVLERVALWGAVAELLRA